MIGVAVHADDALAAVARQPARLALGLRDTVCRPGDRHARGELVLARDEVEERRPLELLLRAPEDVAEGPVRALSGHHGVVIRDDDEARDRVRDRRREVPLPLQLELAMLAVRDVDSAGDDPHDVAVLVDERSRLPGDHALLPERVREDVLVRGRGEAR